MLRNRKYEFYEVLKPEVIESADYITVHIVGTTEYQVLKHRSGRRVIDSAQHQQYLVSSNCPIVLDHSYLKTDEEGYVVI